MEETAQEHPAAAVDEDAVRQRAYELSQARPAATAEENWLLAEQELLAAADVDRRTAASEAAHEEAAAMANIGMSAYGHP